MLTSHFEICIDPKFHAFVKNAHIQLVHENWLLSFIIVVFYSILLYRMIKSLIFT